MSMVTCFINLFCLFIQLLFESCIILINNKLVNMWSQGVSLSGKTACVIMSCIFINISKAGPLLSSLSKDSHDGKRFGLKIHGCVILPAPSSSVHGTSGCVKVSPVCLSNAENIWEKMHIKINKQNNREQLTIHFSTDRWS